MGINHGAKTGEFYPESNQRKDRNCPRKTYFPKLRRATPMPRTSGWIFRMAKT